MSLAWKAAWLSGAINTYNFIQPQPKPQDKAFCPLVFEDDRVIPPSTQGYSEATNRVESWKESKCKAGICSTLVYMSPLFPLLSDCLDLACRMQSHLPPNQHINLHIFIGQAETQAYKHYQ